MKNSMIPWSTPATYGMNSRFFFRFMKTVTVAMKLRIRAQKRSDPRCPAQSPVIL